MTDSWAWYKKRVKSKIEYIFDKYGIQLDLSNNDCWKNISVVPMGGGSRNLMTSGTWQGLSDLLDAYSEGLNELDLRNKKAETNMNNKTQTDEIMETLAKGEAWQESESEGTPAESSGDAFDTENKVWDVITNSHAGDSINTKRLIKAAIVYLLGQNINLEGAELCEDYDNHETNFLRNLVEEADGDVLQGLLQFATNYDTQVPLITAVVEVDETVLRNAREGDYSDEQGFLWNVESEFGWLLESGIAVKTSYADEN